MYSVGLAILYPLLRYILYNKSLWCLTVLTVVFILCCVFIRIDYISYFSIVISVTRLLYNKRCNTLYNNARHLSTHTHTSVV